MTAPPTRTAPKAQSRIQKYAHALRLDPAQTEAAMALHDAHQKAVSDNARRFRDQLREAQEDMDAGDRGAFEGKMQQVMKRQGEETRKLSDAFLADLKALLRPDQEGNWARFERLRRREHVLSGLMGVGGPGGGVGGANVDLTSLVKKLDVPPAAKAAVDEALEAYEVEMDRPLQERERNFDDDREQMGAVQRFTPESFQKKLDRDRAVDLKVREVNDRYARQIAGLLPEDLAKKLEDEYRMRSYRSAYRSTSTGKSLAAAQKLQGLTPAQQQKLKALADAYRRDARAAGDRIAAAIRKAEDEGKPTGGGIRVFGPGGANQDADPGVTAARADRREVDARVKAELEKVLTPEQLADARDAAKDDAPGGARRVEVLGDATGHDMVFVSELDIDEDEGHAGGHEAVVIMRTIEGGPGGGAERVEVRRQRKDENDGDKDKDKEKEKEKDKK